MQSERSKMSKAKSNDLPLSELTLEAKSRHLLSPRIAIPFMAFLIVFSYLLIVYFHLTRFCVTFILVAIASYPLVIYYIHGWRRKADDIILAISPDAAKTYFKAFQHKNVQKDAAKEEFIKFYNKWYGRQFLVFPSIIFVFVVAVTSYILGSTAESMLIKYNDPSAKPSALALPLIACAAAAGSYAFVSWDLIIRVARRNLSASDILGNTIRLAIAVPIGYAFSSLLKDEVGPFIAFAVGAFPLQSVQAALSRLTDKQLGLETQLDNISDKVTKLSGIDQLAADRIAAADITTIPQLAYCDPIQLTMRTHLNFAYVSDIVAQALAWIYFNDNIKHLHTIGIRGAVEIKLLIEDIKYISYSNGLNIEDGKIVLDLTNITFKATDEKITRGQLSLSTIKSAATRLSISDLELLNTMIEIAEDPYTQFLYETW